MAFGWGENCRERDKYRRNDELKMMRKVQKTEMTVVVNSSLVEWVDHQIKTNRYKDRNQAIENGLALLRYFQRSGMDKPGYPL